MRALAIRPNILLCDLHAFLGHVTAIAAGLLFFSRMLNAITGLDQSLAASLVAYPVHFLIVIYLTRNGIPRTSVLIWTTAFLGWSVIATVGWGGVGSQVLLRFGSLFVQTTLFGAALLFYSKTSGLLTVLWRYVAGAGTLFIVISNVLNPSLGFTPYYIAFERYDGVVGTNAHGLICAITAMSIVNYFSAIRRQQVRLLLMGTLALALLNLWATGSRLSLLVFVVFCLLRLRGRYSVVILLVSVPLGLWAMAWALDNWELVRSLLRLDDYSFYGRVNPPRWALQTAYSNLFLPFGLGGLASEIETRRLDSSFLILLLETGLLGIGLVVALFTSTLLRASRLMKLEGEIREDVRSAAAVLTALLIHGLGENTLFTGSNTATWLFWLLQAFIHATYWKRYGR